MPKGRRSLPSDRSSRRSAGLIRVLVFASMTLGCLLTAACQKDDLLKPGSVETNVVTAVYVSSAEFAENTIKLDGQALEREWGGPLDPDRPFTQIRLTADNGSGSPGPPRYVSAKAVYTDSDVFLLMQWTDHQPDAMKDAVFYDGPDLVEGTGVCPSILMQDEVWNRNYGGQTWDEDRFTLAFEMEPTGDDFGSFDSQGCRTACHPGQSPAFGRPAYGRLDVWQWLACRTNVSRNLYTATDNPNSPKYGVPAYLDDGSVDPVTGLTPDPGAPTFLPNRAPGHTRPLYVYRPLNDPFAKPADPSRCFNKVGEKCKVNNGLPYFYIWREDLDAYVPPFSVCDSINNAVLPQGQEARLWRNGDAVSGYYFTYPTDSRADVRGKALHSVGVWTLEIARPLDTRDPYYDVIFPGHAGDEFVFTVAVADNSLNTHWGSGPQILRFGPKSTRAARGQTEGGGR
jgi:hypothetical protein